MSLLNIGFKKAGESSSDRSLLLVSELLWENSEAVTTVSPLIFCSCVCVCVCLCVCVCVMIMLR